MSANLNGFSSFIHNVAEGGFNPENQRIELKCDDHGMLQPVITDKPKKMRWFRELFFKDENTRLTNVSKFLINAFNELESSSDSCIALEKLGNYFHSKKKVSEEWFQLAFSNISPIAQLKDEQIQLAEQIGKLFEATRNEADKTIQSAYRDADRVKVEAKVEAQVLYAKAVKNQPLTIQHPIHPSLTDLRSIEDGKEIFILCKDGKEIGIHPFILKLFPNSFFESYLNTRESLQDEPIDLSSYSNEVVEILIDYLYGGSKYTSMLTEQYLELQELADFLNLNTLKGHIQANLKSMFINKPDILITAITIIYTTRPDLKRNLLPLIGECLYCLHYAHTHLKNHLITTIFAQEAVQKILQDTTESPEIALEKSFLQTLLAYNLANGITERKENRDEAEKLLRQVALRGYPPAMTELGKLLELKHGKPSEEAIQWYAQAAAQNDSYAQNRLGYIYYHSFKDNKKAVELFQKSADQNNPFAKVNLARMFLNAEGIIMDSKNAEIYAKKIVDLCTDLPLYHNTQGRYILSYCYYHGIGVEKNIIKANEMHALASLKGLKNETPYHSRFPILNALENTTHFSTTVLSNSIGFY
ncbi:MAG: BTB/POZ domain-containing protein [Chlamydiales bacterium]|nr:BTB/POZ domain-containing protein [Chlamydiales bacterium]